VLLHRNVKYRVFTQKPPVSCFHTGAFSNVHLHMEHRVSTRRLSCIYTGTFVYLHGARSGFYRLFSDLSDQFRPVTRV
jgi:hypothetical protein